MGLASLLPALPNCFNRSSQLSRRESDRQFPLAHSVYVRSLVGGNPEREKGSPAAVLEAKAQTVFAALPCEPVPPVAGDRYASVKLAQQRLGLPLDENDLWIAATALAIGATLVSYDSDFQRVGTLTVAVP